jgi:hypothetical protein
MKRRYAYILKNIFLTHIFRFLPEILSEVGPFLGSLQNPDFQIFKNWDRFGNGGPTFWARGTPKTQKLGEILVKNIVWDGFSYSKTLSNPKNSVCSPFYDRFLDFGRKNIVVYQNSEILADFAQKGPKIPVFGPKT